MDHNNPKTLKMAVNVVINTVLKISISAFALSLMPIASKSSIYLLSRFYKLPHISIVLDSSIPTSNGMSK